MQCHNAVLCRLQLARLAGSSWLGASLQQLHACMPACLYIRLASVLVLAHLLPGTFSMRCVACSVLLCGRLLSCCTQCFTAPLFPSAHLPQGMHCVGWLAL